MDKPKRIHQKSISLGLSTNDKKEEVGLRMILNRRSLNPHSSQTGSSASLRMVLNRRDFNLTNTIIILIISLRMMLNRRSLNLA